MGKRNPGVTGDARLVKEAELAAMLDVSPRRIRQLADEGTVVKAGPGEYELHASVLGYIRRAASGDEGYEADKARKMKADADMAEIEAAKAAGKLVEAKPLERTWAAAVIGAKTRLRALASRLGPLTVIQPSAQAASEVILKEIDAALVDLSRVGPDADEADAPETAND